MKWIGAVIACGLLLAGCQEKPPKPKVFKSVVEATETLEVLNAILFNYCRETGAFNMSLVTEDMTNAKAYLKSRGWSDDEIDRAGQATKEKMLLTTQQLQAEDTAQLARFCDSFMKMDAVRPYYVK